MVLLKTYSDRNSLNFILKTLNLVIKMSHFSHTSSKAQIVVCLYFATAFIEAHGTNVSLTKSKAAHCPWWWITCFKLVPNHFKRILIAHRNEWKIMTAYLMGKSIHNLEDLLWRIASDAKHAWFVANGLDDAAPLFWFFKGLSDNPICADKHEQQGH